ncbi:hypothetical protein V2A60_009950 [Cordyceps javanica]|uniref:Uncharacterized protein n=1 Tax=Cordyceps javanica TaxID=43265 RepID=A0A545UZS0_9HYPO|nr:hypothetical protein IF1G_05959 [Cordyceps javanica]TQW05819.1 hypothetical protein IF2G_06941 [Cordyceps javanica]
MPPQAPPSESCLEETLEKLTGLDNWHLWHIRARRVLRAKGLRHLLSGDDLDNSGDSGNASYCAADRAAGVGLLADAISNSMLARARDRGWTPENATVLETLRVLEKIVDDEQCRRREVLEREAAARKQLVGLTRTNLARVGVQTVGAYIRAAKNRYDNLLTQYGDGSVGGGVEELLEQLFVSSLMEGLRAAKPAWYAEWKEDMERDSPWRASTQAGVTAWLLAKNRSDLAAATAAAIADASAVGRKPPSDDVGILATGSRRRGRRSSRATRRAPLRQGCDLCAMHHPRSTPHDNAECWFRNPHRAPRGWQTRYTDRVAAVKEDLRRQDRKRRRSRSTSSRHA